MIIIVLNRTYGFDLQKEQVEFFIYNKQKKEKRLCKNLKEGLLKCRKDEELSFRLTQFYIGFKNEVCGVFDMRKHYVADHCYSYIAPYCDSELLKKVVNDIEKYKRTGEIKCRKEY